MHDDRMCVCLMLDSAVLKVVFQQSDLANCFLDDSDELSSCILIAYALQIIDMCSGSQFGLSLDR